MRERWMDDAACAQIGTEFFFPENGGSTREAKAICAACPVKAQCLAFGMNTDQGIWGGTTERVRQRMRKDAAVG